MSPQEFLNLRLRQVLDAAPDAMVIAGRDGRIVFANAPAARLFGYSEDEFAGLAVEALMPERFRPRHPAHVAGYVAAPHARPMGQGLDLAALRKDGGEFPAEISLAPLDTGEGMFVMAAIRDVTERRRMEEEVRERGRRELEAENMRMQEASRLKSEFLANMSHEFRTPLNAIIGFAELMHDAKVGPVSADHKEYLGDILTSARHLHQLINDVLDLAKVEAGRMEFSAEAVEIPRVVREVRDILRGLAAERSVTVGDETGAAPAGVRLDPARLKQVLYNLLSNAIKFTPAGGRVRISASGAGSGRWRLAVEDTGVGIAAADLPHVFSEFARVDAGAAKRSKGAGLGLSLTRRIVEAQGGTIEAASVPGRGSLFTVTLPVHWPGAPGGV